MNAWRHARAILLLPVTATLLVPGALWWLVGPSLALEGPLAWLALAGGVALSAGGLALLVATIIDFARVGRGTLAPWDPTDRLVVRGPYRHVRNPMISGVFFILLGEALALRSWPHVAWFALFVAANAIYIPCFEERGLARRFGSDFDRYRSRVPRWIPRLRPWKDDEKRAATIPPPRGDDPPPSE